MQLRKVCNHPDLFAGRPIVSAFDMLPGVTIAVPSVVQNAARALHEDPFRAKWFAPRGLHLLTIEDVNADAGGYGYASGDGWGCREALRRMAPVDEVEAARGAEPAVEHAAAAVVLGFLGLRVDVAAVVAVADSTFSFRALALRHPRLASMLSQLCPRTRTPPMASAARDSGPRLTLTLGVISEMTSSQYPGSPKLARAIVVRLW